MPAPKAKDIRKIALINFGGIGDELLFSPVIQELRTHLPQAELTLLLEDRSQAVVPLLPPLDAVIPLKLQGTPKPLFFFQLLQALMGKGFDAVISAGSSPFIPLLLFCTGIPHRVGFDANALSQRCLTVAAPLNKQQYAADMYFSLASSFLQQVLSQQYQPPSFILPVLQAPTAAQRAWAADLIKGVDESHQKNILIHPGVSRVSLQKGIDKTWPSEHWVALIQQLVSQHYVYLVGGPDDAAIVQGISAQLPHALSQFTTLYGQTKNLSDLAALIERADLLVSVDSSPLHIAVGLNKPVVALFGPTNEKKLLPQRVHFKAVTRSDLACRPCLWDIRQQNCETSDCLKLESPAMMHAIQEVLAAVSR